VKALFKNDYGNPFEMTGGQEEIFNLIFYKQSPDGKRRIHIMTHTQYGKELSHDTLVLTAIEGWKRHGDLKVGDYVFLPSRSLFKGPKDVAYRVELITDDTAHVKVPNQWSGERYGYWRALPKNMIKAYSNDE